VLRLMRKGTTALANVQLLKWCRVRRGMQLEPDLRLPGEDAKDYEEMVSLISGLHHLKPPDGCGPIRVDRFSPFFVSPEAFGLRNVRHDRSYSYVYDLPENALTNLAYYFEHDYADGRDLAAYSVALHKAVAAWEANAERSRVEYFDDGAALTVKDHRPDALEPELRLAGVERALYLFCDRSRSWVELLKQANALGWSEPDLAAFMQRMRERRLVVTADGRYLSLALRPDRPTAEARDAAERTAVHLDQEELEAVRAKIDGWGRR
jgi:hypothetical protein